MSKRPPVVYGADNLQQQLQPGDTIGANAFFTTPSPVALPTLVALGNSTITLTGLTPGVAGDTIAAGAKLTATPGSALPGGLNISYVIAPSANTVVIGVSSTVAVSLGQTMSWTITDHR